MHGAGFGRVIAAGVLVGTVTAAFGGCARDPSPPGTPSLGPSSAAGGVGTGTAPVGSATGPVSGSPPVSVAPSTSTAPPAVVPLAARAHTEAGAEAFVRFYIDQLNLAWTTPERRSGERTERTGLRVLRQVWRQPPSSWSPGSSLYVSPGVGQERGRLRGCAGGSTAGPPCHGAAQGRCGQRAGRDRLHRLSQRPQPECRV